MKTSKNLIDLFTSEERSKVLSIHLSHKTHPLARLFEYVDKGDNSSDGGVAKTASNTSRAIKHIRQHSHLEDWLKGKASIAAGDNFENAAAALAEIRALGTLLEGGLSVMPVPEGNSKTPDFHGSSPVEFYVEVHCKQMNKTQAEALKEFREQPMPPPDETGFSCKAISVSPMGGKSEETNVENVAQKIAQVKPKSAQVHPEALNILWLDFEDEDLWGASVKHCVPISSSQHRFYSGGIWLAFYGNKGTPLLEHHHIHREDGAIEQTQQMRFDGRFRQSDNLFNAVIISFPSAMICFDNPWRTPPASPHLIFNFMRFLRFDFEHSWLEWPFSGRLISKIEGVLEEIIEISKNAKFCSYPNTFANAGWDGKEED